MFGKDLVIERKKLDRELVSKLEGTFSQNIVNDMLVVRKVPDHFFGAKHKGYVVGVH